MSIMNTDEMALRSVQEERTAGIRLYRPHATKPTKVGIDWDAITPHCKTCGTKTGQLNRDDICRGCSDPADPHKETEVAQPGKPTTRRSAPRAKKASKTSRRARDAGVASQMNRRPGRETRPDRAYRRVKELDDEAIVEAYTGGQSITSICDALGFTNRARIRSILLAAGVEPRHDGPRNNGRGKAVSERTIVEAYKAGATAPHLAEEYGIGASRVRRILDRWHVPRRDDRANNPGGNRRSPGGDQ